MKKDDNYGLIVRHVLRRFTRVLQDGIGPFGITAAEFRVLRVIEDGPLMQSEIAQSAAMDRPFVAASIKKLRKKGFVAARPNASDRRRVDVVLTVRGSRIVHKIVADIIVQSNVVATSGISGADLRTFRDVSRRIVANLDRVYFPAEGGEA